MLFSESPSRRNTSDLVTCSEKSIDYELWKHASDHKERGTRISTGNDHVLQDSDLFLETSNLKDSRGATGAHGSFYGLQPRHHASTEDDVN